MKFIYFVLFSIIALTLASAQAFEKSDCNLPKDVGPCRKADLIYYYDAASKSCQTFFYGGCHGNNNRFSSQQECEKACL